MTRILYDEYRELGLPEFAGKICNECYNSLQRTCEAADRQANNMDRLESKDATSQYTVLCKKLIADIKECLKERHDIHIPYIKTLLEKVENDHDCQHCSGTCKTNHAMRLLELRGAQSNVKNILYRLQMVSLPLYSETKYPDAYRILRNQMALIQNMLAELFFIEEQYLIPKVIEAQNKINANR